MMFERQDVNLIEIVQRNAELEKREEEFQLNGV